MDIESAPAPDEVVEEEKHVSRKQLAQQAIALAVQSRWQEAADVNRQIVDVAPNDAEAYNRLGKAYTELGRIVDARAAYECTLKADPANLIAQRNLDRLSQIDEVEAAELAKRTSSKLDPRFFIEETGKTGLVALKDPADAAMLAKLTAGDQVKLGQEENRLIVTTMEGTFLGYVSEQRANRLIRLMQTGNEYQAGIVGVDGNAVRVIIRETYRSPQNVGRISFPPQGHQDGLPRPYLREGLLRRGSEDEEEDEPDVDVDVDADEDEDEERNEFGFHEASLDES